MGNRIYFLALILCLLSWRARAQSVSYEQTDSITIAQYKGGQWQALLNTGQQAINAGTDFPKLRARMGYAQFMLGNYSAALTQYQQVLNNDSGNQGAHYISYLCNQYLNRPTEANYHLSFVDTAYLNKEHLTKFRAIDAGLEVSVKNNDNNQRGTGTYTRAFFSNALGWRLQLSQSVAYFNQAITSNIANAAIPGGPAQNTVTSNDSQVEYYARLSFALSRNLVLLGAYHYLSTSYQNVTYQNHVGLAGLKFAAPYFSIQADAGFSHINNLNIQQYNGQLTVYPLGNLNLYTITRIAQQSGGVQQTILGQSVGFKLVKSCWLELAGATGNMNNYLENDALYVYNAIDITKNKAGATAFFTAGKHGNIQLNYTYEQKLDSYLNTNYNQHSITGGFTWKF